MMRRFSVLAIVLLVAVTVACAQKAPEPKEEFPAKGITILCGSKAGSPVDVMARELAKHVEKILGKPVVVENKPGGSQAEMLSTLMGQPADGYTLATVTTSTVGVLAAQLREQYKLDDLNFLICLQTDPYALVVRAESPFKDLKDLLEYARQNPGKVKVGGFGSGSGHHMAFLDLCDKTGVQMSWVVFEGGSEAIAAALGGHVDVAHTNPGPVIGHVQAGKMRILAVASEKRLDVLPDVPTYRDQGVDLVLFQWRGVAMRAGAPQPVVDKLVAVMQQAAATPEFKEYMKNTNQFESDLAGERFQQYVRNEFVQTTERLKRLGLIK